jgi:hypothetical protein
MQLKKCNEIELAASALKLIQEDFDQENAKIQEETVLEPRQVDDGENEQQPKFAKKFADIMLASKLQSQSTGE